MLEQLLNKHGIYMCTCSYCTLACFSPFYIAVVAHIHPSEFISLAIDYKPGNTKYWCLRLTSHINSYEHMSARISKCHHCLHGIKRHALIIITNRMRP